MNSSPASFTSLTRITATVSPVAVIGLTLAALAAGGAWLAAVGTAGVCLLLSVLLVTVERHRRIEVAQVKAHQAAAYNKLHAEHSAEHIDYVRHVANLLDERDHTVAALRKWLNETREELVRSRDAVARAEGVAQWAEEARIDAQRRADAAERIAAEAEARLAGIAAGYEVLRPDAAGEDAECVAPEPPFRDEPLVDVHVARVASEDLDEEPLPRTA